MVVDWIWRLNEGGVMPEDWRSAVIVPLHKGKGESGDSLASCMQMIWFCLASQRKI